MLQNFNRNCCFYRVDDDARTVCGSRSMKRWSVRHRSTAAGLLLSAGGRIDRKRRALGAQQQMRAVCHVYSQGTWLNRYLFLFWNGNYHVRKIQYHYNSSHSSEEHASGIFCRHGYSCSKKNAWWSTFGGSVPELQNVADLSLTCRG